MSWRWHSIILLEIWCERQRARNDQHNSGEKKREWRIRLREVVHIENIKEPRTLLVIHPCEERDTRAHLQHTLNDYSVRMDSNRNSAVPKMLSSYWVNGRIWWFIVSKVADRSSQMRTDDLASPLADCRVSVTGSSAVSVELLWQTAWFWWKMPCLNCQPEMD